MFARIHFEEVHMVVCLSFHPLSSSPSGPKDSVDSCRMATFRERLNRGPNKDPSCFIIYKDHPLGSGYRLPFSAGNLQVCCIVRIRNMTVTRVLCQFGVLVVHVLRNLSINQQDAI